MPVGAVDACVWGYPLVLFDAAARCNAQTAGAALAGVMLPNDDVRAQTEWVDLRRGPITLKADATTRYYTLSLFDAWGRNFASLGTRTTGNELQVYAIVPPSWNGGAPRGMRTIEAPTHRIAIVARTPNDGGDVADVHFSIVPIGHRFNVGPVVDGTTELREPIEEQIGRWDGSAFLARLRELIDDSERCSNAQAWRAAIDGASSREAPAVNAAFAEALRRIESGLPLSAPAGGWQTQRLFDARGDAFLERAQSCRFHFLAGEEDDILCRFARVDAAGNPLHGSHAYRLHFEAWNRPPARAFWSLSACDERFRRLPPEVGRSSIRSRDTLTKNPDDSFDIAIQAAAPDEPSVNWLAVPEGAFSLILRLYWPRPAASNGTWSPPALCALGVIA